MFLVSSERNFSMNIVLVWWHKSSHFTMWTSHWRLQLQSNAILVLPPNPSWNLIQFNTIQYKSKDNCLEAELSLLDQPHWSHRFFLVNFLLICYSTSLNLNLRILRFRFSRIKKLINFFLSPVVWTPMKTPMANDHRTLFQEEILLPCCGSPLSGC